MCKSLITYWRLARRIVATRMLAKVLVIAVVMFTVPHFIITILSLLEMRTANNILVKKISEGFTRDSASFNQIAQLSQIRFFPEGDGDISIKTHDNNGSLIFFKGNRPVRDEEREGLFLGISEQKRISQLIRNVRPQVSVVNIIKGKSVLVYCNTRGDGLDEGQSLYLTYLLDTAGVKNLKLVPEVPSEATLNWDYHLKGNWYISFRTKK
jgi:hypothetical protein